MAVEYMLVKIVKSGGTGQERIDASGLVGGEEAFARSDDRQPEDYGARDVWVRSFISRVLGELGDDDWTLVASSGDLRQARAHSSFDLELVLSRPR